MNPIHTTDKTCPPAERRRRSQLCGCDACSADRTTRLIGLILLITFISISISVVFIGAWWLG